MKRLALLLLILALAGAAALLWSRRESQSTAPIPASGESLSHHELAQRVLALEAREQEIAARFWGPELEAQRHGEVLDSLWDELNASDSPLAVLSRVSFDEWIAPDWSAIEQLPHQIELRKPGPSASPQTPSRWREKWEQFQKEGWQLVQSEFRHNRFDPPANGHPARSTVAVTLHLVQESPPARAAVSGDLLIEWAASSHAATSLPRPARIDARGLTLLTRPGEAPFREVLNREVRPPDKSHFIDPLIVRDLDGDGRAEIILAAANLVLQPLPNGQFTSRPLCTTPPGLIFTGIIEDFDGDGIPDFVCARFEGLVLFKGTSDGRFEGPGSLVWAAEPRLRFAQVLTAGDVNGDGHLDLWLGQYRPPYEKGQMPDPYYDAQDGYPSYLLINDGSGRFTDRTEASGLGERRSRRTYSASFIDLDEDGDMDLVLVSDFAGTDLFLNDGRGNFTDQTRSILGNPYALGMAHLFSDLNADGHLDLLVIGMNSPTVDRLEHLGLTRPDRPGYEQWRAALAFGNRLYQGGNQFRFETTRLSDSIARGGWAWGCSAFDFDNDGFPDVYLANGHETRQSVREYEPEFWLHDIYAGTSREDPVVQGYFGVKFARTRGRGHSYGGYEINRLFWNRGGDEFLEIGHLMGVALQADSRNVVTHDIDGDGRMDLIVTTFEVWPRVRQTVRIFRNELETPGHWIGFRFGPGRAAPPWTGTRLRLIDSRGSTPRHLVTGDSYRSQHDAAVHFGLGTNLPEQVEITFPSGARTTLETHDLLHQWNWIPSPSRTGGN